MFLSQSSGLVTINSVTLNSVSLSGNTGVYETPANLVTYPSNLVYGGLPDPNVGNQELVPSFIYFGGDVQYGTDKAGNIIAGNPDKPTGAG